MRIKTKVTGKRWITAPLARLFTAGEKYADIIEIALAGEYELVDLAQCSFQVRAVSEEYDTLAQTREEDLERTADGLTLLWTVSGDFTAVPGHIDLSIIVTDRDGGRVLMIASPGMEVRPAASGTFEPPQGPGDQQKIWELEAGLANTNTGLAATTADLAQHKAAAVHVSEEDRARWDSSAVEIGSYTGDGTATHTVELGYRPRVVLLFTANRAFMNYIAMSDTDNQYTALCTPLGATPGIAATDTGFVVTTSMVSIGGGVSQALNQPNKTYIYLVLR